jgi:hypothetical protein
MGIFFIIKNKYAVYLLIGNLFVVFISSIKATINYKTIEYELFIFIIPFYLFMRWWNAIHAELKNDTLGKEQEKQNDTNIQSD